MGAAVAVASIAAAGLLSAGSARAGELYVKGGFPGAILGWAQPLNSHFGLRIDAVYGQAPAEPLPHRAPLAASHDATRRAGRRP